MIYNNVWCKNWNIVTNNTCKSFRNKIDINVMRKVESNVIDNVRDWVRIASNKKPSKTQLNDFYKVLETL